MIIVDLTYQVPLDQVDAHLPEHRLFLAYLERENYLLYAGPKVPRQGGVMILQNLDLSQAQEIMQQDAFYQKGIARYEYTQFSPK